ncbi:MAG: PAS domain S-box protein [Anaerolineae bacterium]|nr:PAS domain S-box protein [Anaerolineae bacterium]
MKLMRIPFSVRIILIYVAFSAFWLLLFDSLLDTLSSNLQVLATAQNYRTYREWGFVCLSALILFALLGHEQRKSQKTKNLQKRNDYYQALATVSPVGIIHTDKQGRYVEINERTSEIVGITAEQARTKEWTSILHPEDQEYVVRLWESVYSQGAPFNTEFRVRRPDGETIWVACEALAQRDDSGKLQGYIGTIIDITNRKLIEEELDKLAAEIEQQAQMLDQVLSTTPDQFRLYDRQGRHLYVSPPALQVMGAQIEEIVGKTWRDLDFLQELGPQFDTQFEKACNTGLPVSSEYRLPSPDGTQAFETILSPISDDQGNITAVVSTTHDITERKQAEKQLRYHAEIVESVSDAIISTDPDGIIRSWNKAAEAIYGWTEKEAIGKQIADLIGRFDSEGQTVVSQEILAQGHWRGELPHQRKDGTPIIIRISVSVLKDENGKTTGLVMINHDVTEAKRAEQAIKDSERRYRLLFERNPHPMWVVDNDTLAFLAVNESAIQHYGYSYEEFLNMTVGDIQLEQSLPDPLTKITETAELEAHTSIQEIWKHLKKDGTLIDVEITSSPINIFGKSARLALASDITERKQTEEEIQRRSRELAALLNVSNLLARQLEQDIMLEIIIHAVRDLLPAAEATSIWLYDEHQDKLVASAWYGFENAAMKGLALSPDTGMMGRVYRSRQPQNIGDVAGDPEFKSIGDASLNRMRSTLGVPLIAEQQVIGVLFADNFSRSSAFDNNDLRLLEALGGQAAVAIHNVRLYEQVQQELTERRRAEEALGESEERFRRLAQNAPDMIFRWSYRVGFEYVSPASLEVTGYTPEEYYADPGLNYRTVHPDDIPVYDSIFSDLADPERPSQHSIARVFHKDGHIVHLELRMTPIYDEHGELIAMEGIARDVSQHIIAKARLRELSTRLTQAQEEERRRVASELHDEVGQSLTVTKMRLKMLSAVLSPEAEAARDQLKTLGGLVEESLQTVRSLSHQLRPPLLDEMGWQPALEWLCEGFSKRTQMPIQYQHQGMKKRLDPDIELAVYRVVQEALTNVLRHANASQVEVSSALNATKLKVAIKDDGRGFDFNALRNDDKPDIGLGLLSMQERIDINRGRLQIESKPGKGTRVEASFPVIFKEPET